MQLSEHILCVFRIAKPQGRPEFITQAVSAVAIKSFRFRLLIRSKGQIAICNDRGIIQRLTKDRICYQLKEIGYEGLGQIEDWRRSRARQASCQRNLVANRRCNEVCLQQCVIMVVERADHIIEL